MKVEIYSDVVCPWCYIGLRRFERALAGFSGASDVVVVFRPYQLDPAAPAEPFPLRDRLARKFGARADDMVENVTRTAGAEGIEIDFDIGVAANTLAAHRLLWLVERDHGPAVQRDLATRLFAAHFTEGIDVGDRDRLVEIASIAGLDHDRVRALLDSDEGGPEVSAAIRAAQRMGISAVPTFIIDDRYVIQGGQPAPVFLQALETAARDAAVPTTD